MPQELQSFVRSDEEVEEVPEGSFHESVRACKRKLVCSALRMYDGNKLKAARELGISRCYLHRLLNQLRITEVAVQEDFEDSGPLEIPVSRARARGLSIASRAS